MKVVSLFCGCGGMDLGFLMAGHKIIWANDIDKNAIATYKYNICRDFDVSLDSVVLGDIRKIPSSDIPNCDMVIGGFPCQGFSVANRYRKVDDERNFLYLEMLRIIKDKQPKYFVAENVPGILSIGKGEVIKMILRDFNDVGYDTQYKVLNAANYGVPQVRKRVIILGARKDTNHKISYPMPTHYDKPQKTTDGKTFKKWITVKEAIGDLEGIGENPLINHTFTLHSEEYKERVRKTPLGKGLYDSFRSGSFKCYPNKPSVTVRGGHGGVLLHYSEDRLMSPRELARLQSFPDSFIFIGGRNSIIEQIGNAVPPLMAYHIAKEVEK